MRVTGLILLLSGCAPGAPSGDSDSGGAGPIVSCVSLVQPDGSPTGLEHCWPDDRNAYGQLNRVAVVPCQVDPIDPAAACGGWGGAYECAVNGDCGPDAVCGNPYGGCTCTSVCATDADCGAGETCLCDQDVGAGGPAPWIDACHPAACKTGADCASGICGVSVDGCGWSTEELGCRTAQDECAFDADCPDGGTRCRYDADQGRWACLAIATCD